MFLRSNPYPSLLIIFLAVAASCGKPKETPPPKTTDTTVVTKPPTDTTSTTPPPTSSTDSSVTDKGWLFETAPTWQDDFAANGSVDSSKWKVEDGADYSAGELQYFTPGNHNVTVQDGVLTIEARKEDYSGKQYTSARLSTKGTNDFLYGRLEISAKLPGGKGPWATMHLMPTENKYGSYPASGEIDMVDYVGYDTNNVHISLASTAYHTSADEKHAVKNVPGVTDTFHTYSIDWTPYAIRGYIDNVKYFEYTNDSKGSASWPFNQKFYLVLSEVVGGGWGGAFGVDDAVFPSKMQIRSVKYYKMIDK